MAKRRARKKTDVEKGRVRVHDPFELVRWLALSQPDPRKALAELVQNSLDAGAKRVRITRVRERKLPCLKILDDGEGVIPDFSRPEALRYIATHIGHSRKRDLSPKQRLDLMTQGQYGIGLLGFWSLGEGLEIRSHVPGEKPYRLVLHRDRPEFEIEPLRGKLAFDDRWTEVVVVNLTKEASAVVSARRASDYLASELRGQLLGREVELAVEDKMARGRSPKLLRVRPTRFLGERIEGLGPIEVAGHASIRLEVYLAGELTQQTSPALALYAAGTLVAEDFGALGALGLDHPPWTDTRLTGLVDFPELNVAPGSRRGVVPDETAREFASALVGIEPVLSGFIEAKEQERSEELDKKVIRDLQRAFRDFYRRRPSYTMLPTETAQPGAGNGDGSGGAGVTRTEDAVTLGDAEMATETGAEVTALFPPGPLSSVRITPKKILLEPSGESAARATALDAEGRAIGEGVAFSWELWGQIAQIHEDGRSPNRIKIAAGENIGEGILSVHAREVSSGHEASLAAPIEVVGSLASGTDEGIPEPELVDLPGAKWRSRLNDGRWEVNSGHPDYPSSSSRPAMKLRYLAMLFAKEVVLRSTQDPRLAEPLEQMVEVSAYADRHLTEKQPTGRRRRTPRAD